MPQSKFALISTLIGTASFLAASLALAAIDIALHGSGPHGYGTFVYIVAPMFFTPAGFVAGLVLGLLIKSQSYARLAAGLGAVFIGYTLLLMLLMRIL